MCETDEYRAENILLRLPSEHVERNEVILYFLSNILHSVI